MRANNSEVQDQSVERKGLLLQAQMLAEIQARQRHGELKKTGTQDILAGQAGLGRLNTARKPHEHRETNKNSLRKAVNKTDTLTSKERKLELYRREQEQIMAEIEAMNAKHKDGRSKKMPAKSSRFSHDTRCNHENSEFGCSSTDETSMERKLELYQREQEQIMAEIEAMNAKHKDGRSKEMPAKSSRFSYDTGCNHENSEFGCSRTDETKKYDELCHTNFIISTRAIRDDESPRERRHVNETLSDMLQCSSIGDSILERQSVDLEVAIQRQIMSEIEAKKAAEKASEELARSLQEEFS